MVSDPTSVFEQIGTTPQRAAENLLSPAPEVWEAHRDAGIPPRVVSSREASQRSREEFLTGARMLGLDTPRKPIQPQQLTISDALGAEKPDGRPLNATVGILIPRRSSKTTSIIAVALGRCASRTEYRVAFTLATTGAKARERFLIDIVGPLERAYPDPDTRPFAIRKSQGSERITWPNGSIFSVLTPVGEAFRSDAFDLIIIDESGEASPELSEDLLQGTLATMDTRPDGQIVIAGTAPEFRDGNLLWDTLQDGRNEVPGVGIVEYSAPEPITAEELADWDLIEPIVRAAHPGIGGLTTIDVIRERHRKLKPGSFVREYLSIAGRGGQVGALFNYEEWLLLGAPELPTIPEDAAIALAVHPDRNSAAVMAAWRVDGRAHVAVLKHAPGLTWITDYVGPRALKRKTPIVHDSVGEVLVVVEWLSRLRPRPQTLSRSYREVKTATALFLHEVATENLTHYHQEGLNEAVRLAIRRVSKGSTLFGRRLDVDDITPLEAASLALHAYDSRPRRQPLPRMT